MAPDLEGQPSAQHGEGLSYKAKTEMRKVCVDRRENFVKEIWEKSLEREVYVQFGRVSNPWLKS